jgi:hypothetical protein
VPPAQPCRPHGNLRPSLEVTITNHLRTLLARLVVRWLPGPRSLLVRAWAWLCAETDNLGEKQRCLEQILDLDPDLVWAQVALEGVLEQAVTKVHLANAEELATIAEEIGAEVLCGGLRYPSESGGWRLGDPDLSEHLAKYRDHELVVIIAATGRAMEPRVVCGICGFVLDEVGECPRCKLIDEEIAEGWRRRQEEEREEMLGEVEEILKEQEDE